MSALSAGIGSLRFLPRTFLLLSFVVVLVGGAVALRNPVPLLAAVPLLLVPVVAAGGRLQGSRSRSTDLTWEAEGAGAELEISGHLSGPFGGEAAGIDLVLPPISGATVTRPARLERAPEGIRFSLGLRLAEPSLSVFDPPAVVHRDPMGLTEEVLPGVRPGLTVERYPPELRRLGAAHLNGTLQLPGETRSHRLGPTGEFFGLRPAGPNESPRRINWRASARVGRLLANDFQVDRTGDILLLLDLRPTAFEREIDERLLGIARAGIYGIAESFLRTKVRVGYAAFGEFLDAVPLSTGRAHRLRIKEAILAGRRSEVAGPPERCTLGLRRYFRPGLTALIVSTVTGDPTFDLLPYLRRSGYPSILVTPSPFGLRTTAEPDEPSFEEVLARRLEQAGRRALLARLWEHGPVIDWADYWSLAGLARFLRQPVRRRVT